MVDDLMTLSSLPKETVMLSKLEEKRESEKDAKEWLPSRFHVAVMRVFIIFCLPRVAAPHGCICSRHILLYLLQSLGHAYIDLSCKEIEPCYFSSRSSDCSLLMLTLCLG